jgi:hypothetical protein
MNTAVIRVLLFIVMFVLVLMLPWWLSAILLFGLTIYFPFYLEILFFGFLFDTLYSVKLGFPYTGLTIATVFLLITMFVRTRIRT